MRTNKNGRRWCKIVLTGGPCSGKTTALGQLRKRLEKDGLMERWKVFTVPETATLLYSGGVNRNELSEKQIQQWQQDILRVMFCLEAAYENLAEDEVFKDVLILCDRGGMDSKVFTTSEQQWAHILSNLELTEKMILERYDCAIRLHSAPSECYQQANTTNLHRRERSHKEALMVDAKFDRLWSQHPNYREICDSELSFPTLVPASATLEGIDVDSQWNRAWELKFEKIYGEVKRHLAEE